MVGDGWKYGGASSGTRLYLGVAETVAIVVG